MSIHLLSDNELSPFDWMGRVMSGWKSWRWIGALCGCLIAMLGGYLFFIGVPYSASGVAVWHIDAEVFYPDDDSQPLGLHWSRNVAHDFGAQNAKYWGRPIWVYGGDPFWTAGHIRFSGRRTVRPFWNVAIVDRLHEAEHTSAERVSELQRRS